MRSHYLCFLYPLKIKKKQENFNGKEEILASQEVCSARDTGCA